jgi:hypothetical protein
MKVNTWIRWWSGSPISSQARKRSFFKAETLAKLAYGCRIIGGCNQIDVISYMSVDSIKSLELS